jgi:hypothetical protein
METTEKRNFLESLNNLIEKSTKQLHQILEQFNWDKDTLMRVSLKCGARVPARHAKMPWLEPCPYQGVPFE